jgi:N utilization substance protein B
MRKIARETVFKLLFEHSFLNERNTEGVELLMLADDFDDDDKAYIKATYDGVIASVDSLKEKISAHLQNYRIERLYRPDLIVLMLATYELEEQTAPHKVVINEAVDLAKRYGTEKSGKFVNGVLANMIKTY